MAHDRSLGIMLVGRVIGVARRKAQIIRARDSCGEPVIVYTREKSNYSNVPVTSYKERIDEAFKEDGLGSIS